MHGVYCGGRWDEADVIASVDAILADAVSGKIAVPINRMFPLVEAAEERHRFGRDTEKPNSSLRRAGPH